MRLISVLLLCLCLTAPVRAMESDAASTEELYPGEQALYREALTEGLVVSYNTGPDWANFRDVFRAFHRRYPGVELIHNDIGSLASLAALEAFRDRPQADTVYYSTIGAVRAKARRLTQPFKPVGYEQLHPLLRDGDEGHWFGVHRRDVAFMVNRALLRTVPTTWAELAEDDYRDAIVYADPSRSALGLAAVYAAAAAHGGGEEDPMPGVEFFERLHRIGNIRDVAKGSPYGRFVNGEIPLWIGYLGDGLRSLGGMADCEVVVPEDGPLAVPYAMSLVNGAPHPNAGKLWLNFVLHEGQELFRAAGVEPILSADVDIHEMNPAAVARNIEAVRAACETMLRREVPSRP